MHEALRAILPIYATRGFDRGLLSGIARYASLKGTWTFYRQPHGYLASKRQLDLNELRAWEPDGAFCPDDQLDRFLKLGVPLVAYTVNEETSILG